MRNAASTRLVFLCATLGYLGATAAWAIPPSLTLAPASNHPGGNVKVSGSGFSPYTAVDIYFDTTDEALAGTDGSGGFSNVPVPVPSSATPGTHYITGVQRYKDRTAQTIFTVNTDWAQFHFNEKQKGLNAWENVISPYNASSLDTYWTATAGSAVYTTPTVAEGIAYIINSNGDLDAFDATTGAEMWSDSHIASSEVANGLVPVVANGLVFAGSYDEMYAFNASTGALAWSAGTGSPNYVTVATVANGVVYAADQGGAVFAFDAKTGAALWSAAMGGADYSSSPAVANGVVYVGCFYDSNLYAFDATDGTLLWKAPTGNYIFSSPAVVNGVVYIGSGDGNLYAFNAETGYLRWSAATGGIGNSSPAVANGIVYIGSDDSNLYAFNANSGALLWKAPTGGFIESSPAVANDVVYVGSDDSNIYAFEASYGYQLWTASTGNITVSSPSVSNGVVYIGSDDKNLYAFALNGGGAKVYHRHAGPPKISSLHPDFRLKRSNQTLPSQLYEGDQP